MDKMTILDYFDEVVDYDFPYETLEMEVGVFYDYTSSDALLKILNKTAPIKLWQADRYTGESYAVRYNKTKAQLREAALNGFTPKDTYINCFFDDLYILATVLADHYVWFHYDHDTSDCGVGVFKTHDSEDLVVRACVSFLDKEANPNVNIDLHHDNGMKSYTELPVTFLNGQIR